MSHLLRHELAYGLWLSLHPGAMTYITCVRNTLLPIFKAFFGLKLLPPGLCGCIIVPMWPQTPKSCSTFTVHSSGLHSCPLST